MTQTRPNILLIMDDQHRHDYLGAAGAEFLNTPNLDRLSERGVHFTQCTTNCPVCAPSRIGLASGFQPSRIGSTGNDSYLPANMTTYYQRLRDAGYRVGCVGKLDLAKPDGYNGRDGDRPRLFGWGFTHPVEVEGKMHAGMSDLPQGPYGFWLEEQELYQKFRDDYRLRGERGWIKNASHDSVLPTEAFADTYIGRRSADWISQIPDDYPWHLFVSFVGPHDPFDPPTEYADRYRNAEMPLAVESGRHEPAWVEARRLDLTAEEVTETRRQYCASTELIDHQIGMILEALDRRGMRDNTYIIFASDHGEMLGDRGQYTKSLPYEASVRVPLIAAGPGIQPGRTSDALIELIDLNPTICAIAGLVPQGQIDARSFNAILSGSKDDHRTEAVSAIRNFRMIRTHQYKLIQHYNGITELFDIVEDPHELSNVAPRHPEMVRDLMQRMSSRFSAEAGRGA